MALAFSAPLSQSAGCPARYWTIGAASARLTRSAALPTRGAAAADRPGYVACAAVPAEGCSRTPRRLRLALQMCLAPPSSLRPAFRPGDGTAPRPTPSRRRIGRARMQLRGAAAAPVCGGEGCPALRRTMRGAFHARMMPRKKGAFHEGTTGGASNGHSSCCTSGGGASPGLRCATDDGAPPPAQPRRRRRRRCDYSFRAFSMARALQTTTWDRGRASRVLLQGRSACPGL